MRGKKSKDERPELPVKTFTHDGTQYEMRGNLEMAQSHFHEARAHFATMKRANVNDLPIIQGAKYFDDGTEVHLRSVYGKDDILVVSPIVEKVTVTEGGGTQPEIRIVPVIRSVDDRYWVACLSGTFDGPYYAFKNDKEIPPEALADNIEQDLDGQLISIGKTPIDNSIDDPEIYFIAQTGRMPDKVRQSPAGDAPGYSTFPVGDRIYTKKENEPWTDACNHGNDVEDFWGKGIQHYSFAPRQWEYNQWIECDGIKLGVPESTVQQNWEKSYWRGSSMDSTVTWYFFGGGWYSCPDDPGEFAGVVADYRTQTQPPGCAFEQEMLAKPIFDTSGHHSQPTLSTATSSKSVDIWTLAGDESVRLEDGSSFMAGYKRYTYAHQSTSQTTPDYWDSSGDVTVSTFSESEEYSYHINLDGREYTIREPSPDEYPSHEQYYAGSQTKYYGKDSSAPITGLMSTAVFTSFKSSAPYPLDIYAYHYIGPATKNELHTTNFGEESNTRWWEHNILNNGNVMVDENGSDLLFDGRVFLARIQYTTSN